MDDDEIEDRRIHWFPTEDIYECECGHQGPALISPTDKLECEDCGSTKVTLFVKKPLNIPKSADKEESLNETDPDWKEQFHGDIERAYDFYFKP